MAKQNYPGLVASYEVMTLGQQTIWAYSTLPPHNTRGWMDGWMDG